MKKNGIIFVISSPSGGGKTTICRKVLAEFPELLFSVSITSRISRSEEKEGRDYFFITEDKFAEKIKNNEFAEWAEVHNHQYGTPRRFLDEAVNSGKYVILDIDVKGAFQIKEKYQDACLIFLLPPSLETLAARLEKRKTDNPEEIKKRLARAKEELLFLQEYNYAVINGDLSQAVEEIKAIIKAESCRVNRMTNLTIPEK